MINQIIYVFLLSPIWSSQNKHSKHKSLNKNNKKKKKTGIFYELTKFY